MADTLWLLTARARGTQHWVCNTDADAEAIRIGQHEYPVILNKDSTYSSSYVQSPRSTWLRYPYQEALRAMPPAFQWLAQPLLKLLLCPLSTLLSTSRLEHAVCPGNYLISTNLYPEWESGELGLLTEKLCTAYPQKPFMIRNICPDIHPALADELQQKGWLLLPSRLVYLCDPSDPAVWKHNHIRKDMKLLDDGYTEHLQHEQLQPQDLPALRSLFRQLFIDKYSCLNPDFSDDFFSFCLETRFLELHALRWQGRYAGVLGLYQHPDSGWITTPLIGYDTSLPKEAGIYRRLMALLLREARNKNLRLHYSSGAGHFKRARGGKPVMEYSAVYGAHLPAGPRLALQSVHKLLHQLAPSILKKADGLDSY